METGKNKDIQSFLTFKVGEELYAVNVNKILSILELVKITKIPRTPDFVRGIINHLGLVLPIVDIRIKFDLPATDLNSGACILALEMEMDGNVVKFGALVDMVDEVLELDTNDILPPPNLGKSYRSDFIDGFYKTEQTVIMIMNVDKLFSEDEITVLNYSEMVIDDEEKETPELTENQS
jgi:purine-binding chemotaxis protein CheW